VEKSIRRWVRDALSTQRTFLPDSGIHLKGMIKPWAKSRNAGFAGETY